MWRGCNKGEFMKYTLVLFGFLILILCYTLLCQTVGRKGGRYKEKESESFGQMVAAQQPAELPNIICNGDKRRKDANQLKWKLTDLKLSDFLPNYKNPCFYWNVTLSNGPQLKTTRQIRCLPYFFIAGFPKSGTTDLWARLMKHPDIVIRHKKEPDFFHKHLVGNETKPPLGKYIETFTKTSLQIQKLISPALCHGKFPYYYGITGDASSDTCFDVPRWKDFPENENCPEPRITNANYVHKLMPNLNVIMLLRNPVERLYSDYIYETRHFGYNLSVQDFHETVVQTIRSHRHCQEKHPIRACAYNSTIEPQNMKARVRVGMYHIFVKDWLDVFPREQILIIKAEDMASSNMSNIYRQICRFLDIRPFTRDEEIRILNTTIRTNVRRPSGRKLGDMLNKTRKILTEFYSSHNEKLAKLLQSDKFLWND